MSAEELAAREQSLTEIVERSFDTAGSPRYREVMQALVRALKIKGGAMQRLTNDHPRYAVRELMYLDLYPPSSPQQTFSGTEFLGIIGRIEDYQRGNPADYPAAVLPGEKEQGAAAGAGPGDATTRPTTRPTTSV